MTANDSRPAPITREQADDLIRRHTVEVSHPAVPKQPKVSVCMVTYNHARFIAQALGGALAQQTDFPYEIVVGDDHSSDSTTQIVLDYQKRHPNKIRVLQAAENLGKYTGNGRLNFIRTLQVCRGNYIALLEGDDYWTDKEKLQKQVGLMESQPDVTLCGHRALMPSENWDGQSVVFPEGPQHQTFTLADVVARNRMHTCTLMIRREVIQELPEWVLRAPVADHALQVLAALRGKVAFLDAVMGYYRVHEGGVWSGRNVIRQAESCVKFYEIIRPVVPANCWRKAACTVFAEAARAFRAEQPARAAYWYLRSFQLGPSHVKRLCAVGYYLSVSLWRRIGGILAKRR